ncbi:MAG: hypothetical protein ACI37V_01870 [Methanobrevibacter sp.]
MLLISLLIISVTSISGADNSTGNLDSMISNESGAVVDNLSDVANDSAMDIVENNLENNIVENTTSTVETSLDKSSTNETTISDEGKSTDRTNVSKLGSNVSNNIVILNNTSVKDDGILGDENPVIYYVSMDGSDSNDGSESSPFRTIAHGIQLANTNDITRIIVKKGNYAESNLTINSNVILEGMDNPAITPSGSNSVFIINNTCVVIDGFTFAGGRGTVVKSDNSNLTVINSLFANNTASPAGGIYFVNGNLNITNSNFTNCIALNGGDGGAIHMERGMLYIYDSLFDGNIARAGSSTALGSAGGSIFADRTNVYLVNSTVKNSLASEFGGGVFAGGNLTIIDSSIVNNTAGYGSGVYCEYLPFYDYGYLTVINSTFENNTGNNLAGANNLGGAVYSGYADVESSRFISNNVTTGSYGNGGAIYTINDMDINNSVFTNNIASYQGGALYSYDGSITVKNSNFTNNTAYLGGGALIADHLNNNMVNCSFINDTAGSYGGAVSLRNGTIVNSTFIDNKAQMGAALFINDALINNSVFINNEASRGYGIEIFANVTFINSLINGTALKEYYYPYVSAQMQSITSDGFYCFCLEHYNLPPDSGSLGDGLRTVYNYKTNTNVEEYLKILYYTYYETLSDDQSDTGKKALSEMQNLTWIFTDSDFTQSTNSKIQNVVNLYNSGFRVNTTHAIKTLSNGTKAYMVFRSFYNGNNNQNMVMFKLEPFYDNLTVVKETLDANVLKGNIVRFNITVLNNGGSTLSHVFINDSDFDKELVLVGYENGSLGADWNYTNGLFVLDSLLAPNQTVSLILLFNTTANGTFTNNVTAGFDNITLSNSSNKTVVFDPRLEVLKITNTKVVYIGNITSFTIVVRNAGDCNLSNVQVTESSFDGLEFSHFEGADWSGDSNVYTLNKVLAPGESSNFTVYFKALEPGDLTNIVVASSNETGNKSAMNTTEVKNITNSTDNNDTNNTNNTGSNSTTNKTNMTESSLTNNGTKTETGKNMDDVACHLNYGTGNPLYLLLVSLCLLGTVYIKGKK